MMATPPDVERSARRLVRALAWDDDCKQAGLSITSNPPQMNDDLYEYRFEQRYDEYTLRLWHGGNERSHRGFVDNLPDWLKAILATARVAGAIPKIKEPPPDIILWFRTDEDKNLVEFIEMK